MIVQNKTKTQAVPLVQDHSMSFNPYLKVLSVPEVGNANASRGQADGHGARRHYSELESHVLAGGAAAALFQIIVARQEC